MKIKLNSGQIARIRRELKETDRKDFDTDDVSGVFRMLQYWAKSIGAGEPKVTSVTEIPGGYLCRVNSRFRDLIRTYLKQARSRLLEESAKTKREREMQETVERYDQLIKEAEQNKRQPKNVN